MHLQNLLSTFHEPSAHLHLSHKHISASFKVRTILYLHFPRTVNHLCPARSTALYSIMLQSSCAKKKKSPSRKKPQFQPFVLELVPYNNISHQSIWTERYTCKKKNWSKYTRLPFIISCVQEQKFTSLIKERKKEKKNALTIRIKSLSWEMLTLKLAASFSPVVVWTFTSLEHYSLSDVLEAQPPDTRCLIQFPFISMGPPLGMSRLIRPAVLAALLITSIHL